MAQQAKNSNTMKWMLGVGVPIIIYLVVTSGGSSSPATSNSKATDKKKAAANGQSMYTEGDKNAHFEPYAIPVVDRFQPLVYKASPGTVPGPLAVKSDLNIPTNFTGGENNWGFTGTVYSDGHWSALVENGANAQNAYIKKGDKWKSSTVVNVSENLLTLRDLSGDQKDVMMQADIQAMMAKAQADLAELKASTTPNRTSNSPFAPMNPGGMVGAISPDGSTMADTGANVNDVQMNGYGGRRRRGGRGGRGGGGGNGGGFGG